MAKFEFEAIGTYWQIDIKKELSSKEEAFLLDKIKNRIADFDKTYSRFREDSLVFKMSKDGGSYNMPSDADLIIQTYKKVYDVTLGKVTPLIGETLIDSGYDHKYSLIPKERLSKPLLWDEVIEWNNPILTIKIPKMLDFGAGGKGYLVDIVSNIIEDEGVVDYCVDAGGDIRQKSSVSESLKVGLEHPEDFNMVIGTVDILNQSLCGSSGNRRKWGEFNHIIDPDKLSSPKDILAIWTIAENTLLADILATALSFVSGELLKKEFNFEYLVFFSNHTVEKSSGFNAELFK